MIRRAFKLIGVSVVLSFGQPQVQGQVQQSPQVQTPPPPQAQVDVEVPKDVREYLELRKKILKEQKKSELEKIKRQEKFEGLQSSLSSLQHYKGIMLEKKSIDLIKRLPPVFYSVELAGVVGEHAISKSGIVMSKGYKVGTAEVEEVSVSKGVLLKDGKVVYPADSTGVKMVFSELYQETKQTQSVPPPPPIISSPSSLPPLPPPPPPK
jgi:hypothetical protein